jgi:ribose 5-phosphate isomerase B
MRIGIAADHAGFTLKKQVAAMLREAGHSVIDFGPTFLNPGDDYPDYVVPLARAVASGEVKRGIAICGSGVGACIAANKVPKVRAAPVSTVYSARQGVEDDNMNVICLGGRVTHFHPARRLIRAFLTARFSGKERFRRRLAKIAALEKRSSHR